MSRGGGHLAGILGGMGPAATADFYAQLVRSTPATRDQDHLRVAIWADPAVPDRVAAVRGRGADAYPAILDGACKLRDLGATIVAVPCHTAHYYLDRLAVDTGLPFIDMTAETVAAVTGGQDPVGTVGLLGTRGTLHAGLYQRRFAGAGVRTTEPDPDAQRAVDLAVENVKAGDTHTARAHAEDAARRLADAGADVVVLACTELPLALRDGDHRGVPPLVDPTVLLARAVVRECLGPG